MLMMLILMMTTMIDAFDLCRWFPDKERASAVGISMAGFHMGNVISLLATPLIMSSAGIAGPFALFSALGFLWLTIWGTRVSNDPKDNHLISRAELLLIQTGKKDVSVKTAAEIPSLGRLFSKLPTWAVVLANITNNWVRMSSIKWE